MGGEERQKDGNRNCNFSFIHAHTSFVMVITIDNDNLKERNVGYKVKHVERTK